MNIHTPVWEMGIGTLNKLFMFIHMTKAQTIGKSKLFYLQFHNTEQ